MASGTIFSQLEAHDGRPTASNPAGLTLRNQQWVVAFDSATSEYWVFGGKLNGYSGGGLSVIIDWMSTATTGGVAFDGQFERQDIGGLDLDGDSFAAVQTATGTTQATAGMLQTTTIAFTDGAQMDSVADGENFRFKLSRQVAHASDTLAADAQVLRVQIKET